MRDKTPQIYDYIRLMQEHTPCITEWRYTDKDGNEVTAPLEECIRQNQENGAEYSSVGVFRTDLKCLVDVPHSYLPPITKGNIDIDGDERIKAYVEKIINNVVKKADKPQPIEELDFSHCKTNDEFSEVLNSHIAKRNDYIAYVETCNSLKLLYNLLTPEVNKYLAKRKIAAGVGSPVGGYDNLIEYYQEVAKCKNLVKKGCEKIVISVKNGSISNVQLFGRKGKDVYDIPLLDKRTDVVCRIDMEMLFRCTIGKIPFPEMNTALQILNSFVDPKDKWTDVKNMSFHYEPDSDYFYTFAEVRDNIAEYLNAESKHEIREKNTFTQDICNRLGGLYRFLIECDSIKIRTREDAWSFICDLWNFDGDIRVSGYEYIVKFRKDKLPIQFTTKPK